MSDLDEQDGVDHAALRAKAEEAVAAGCDQEGTYFGPLVAVADPLSLTILALLDEIEQLRGAAATPRVVEPGPNQAAELDALPAETVLRWSDGVDVPIVIEKGPTRRWYETACAGSPSVSTVVAYNVPWTVLYLPA